MRLARLSAFTGPSDLSLVEAPEPTPGPDQIAVRVTATALNRADLLQTMGLYPAPPGVAPDVPGLEYAGTVAALGPGVTRWRVGDRVMGLVAGGAWAEVLVTHALEVLPVPERLSLPEAAALPEAFLTAFDALELQGHLRAGERVLIHAAGSGVGSAAVQLVRWRGATAIGASRTASKLDRLKPLGLAHAVSLASGWPDQVRALTGGRGVDLVLDLVGGEVLPETLRACASNARLMLVGLTAGATAEVPLGLVLSKRLTLTGTTLRSRPHQEKAALARAFEAQVLPAFADGTLQPVIGERLPFDRIREGLERLASNQTFGKLVVTLGE